ncbi:hypothetical protein FE810_05320 [Thalassotalea litorea]|uniref:Uncharacterized protein n=1 Tax=Thalassotalea litorea TaxID=2020715 RepID=A0A5R9IS88_9GAMM|nr:hypothetical protein [Thalassotalea litorea]TLU66927.1 hypothetical protein FE810_05320 [Thalassotalea litorea]
MFKSKEEFQNTTRLIRRGLILKASILLPLSILFMYPLGQLINIYSNSLPVLIVKFDVIVLWIPLTIVVFWLLRHVYSIARKNNLFCEKCDELLFYRANEEIQNKCRVCGQVIWNET